MKEKKAALLQGLVVTSLLLVAAGPVGAQVAPQCWSSAGTSAVLNPEDLSSATLSGPTMTVSGSATLPVTLNSRLSVSGILQDIGGYAQAKLLGVRFLDNGPEAQIFVALRQVDMVTGVASTIATFDSNAFPASSGFQFNQVATACQIGGGFDFVNYMYFMNISVSKTGSSGDPGLWLIRVCMTAC